MTPSMMTRRSILTSAACLPVLALPGCAGGLGGFGLVDAIRELLTLSSQRAFAQLLRPGGFFDSNVARIEFPREFGGGAAGALLSSPAVRNGLLSLLNDAAEDGAERAAPLVYDAIRTLDVRDAVSIVRGGPRAATVLLERAMGASLITAMFPVIGDGLRLANSGILNQLLGAATGINFSSLADNVSRQASDGIYRAIGEEEAKIRADPSSTNSRRLQTVFGLL